MRTLIYRNLPNIVSMLGVAPLLLLFLDDGFSYFIPLVIYNNVMDDLDGILARELKLSSGFGARLDNVCDAVSHIIITFAVGAHFGGVVLGLSLVTSAALLTRVIQRLAPEPPSGIGSPTNELMRHLLLTVIIGEAFDIQIVPVLCAVLVANAVSMLVPFRLRYMLRTLASTTLLIVGVNILLLAAWTFSPAAIGVAALVLGTYLASVVVGAKEWYGTKVP